MSHPSAGVSERVVASPYARRLARERGLRLEGRRGSGPNGRIVASDLDQFVPDADARPAAPTPPAERLAPASSAATPADLPIARVEAPAPRQISSFGATLDLGPITALLPEVAKVAPAVSLDDFLLKALGRALVLAGSPAATIIWQDGAVKTVIVRADELSPSGIAALRSQGTAAIEGPAILVTRIRASVRPASAALDESMTLRLVLAGEGDASEALLVFDEAVTEPDIAARLLAALRDCLGHPLRLLV
jgi:pyruvate dehydrogenase E2 component (dihydrolipoamide acetyltransferase)